MGATGVVRARAGTIRRRALAVSAPTLAPAAISVPARAAPTVTRVPGIDVSKWQGDVDWAEIATTTTRYAIMRATIGNTATTPRSIDPKYVEYLTEATANGLVVGAYHRANVGTRRTTRCTRPTFSSTTRRSPPETSCPSSTSNRPTA